MQEQLVGYLLGALDADEQSKLEAQLAVDADLRRNLEELRAQLAPLAEEAEEQELAPPEGLAEQACRFVRSYAGWGMQPEPATAKTEWHFQDLLVAAGIFVTASMLIFPAVSNSRFQSRMQVCQNNLRELGTALLGFANDHNGMLPHPPLAGNMAAAGIFGPTLVSNGYLQDHTKLVCPETETAGEDVLKIPTLEDFAKATPEEAQNLRRSLWIIGYGYHPGHIENGRYVPTRMRARGRFVILADAPSDAVGGASLHHGEMQNVLTESGSVVVLRGRRIADGSDDIFVNDQGTMSVGLGANDSVVFRGDMSPILVSVRGR